jgi:hypothetical protein
VGATEVFNVCGVKGRSGLWDFGCIYFVCVFGLLDI